jgi:hypothetical protein
MRAMLIVKSTSESETRPPSAAAMSAMNDFNQKLMRDGKLLSAEGLMPTAMAVKVQWTRGKRRVVDGPFTEAKELIGGFWILKVKDMAEAVAIAESVPFQDGEIEIRKCGDVEDYPEMTKKNAREEKALGKKLAANAKKRAAATRRRARRSAKK